jgi:hypothetical protein
LAEIKGEGILTRGSMNDRGTAVSKYSLLVRKKVSRLRKIL